MAWGYPYKRKPFGLMGGYLGDRGAGPMGSGNIEIPHLPPSYQRTPEQSVGGGLPTDRLNRYNRWLDIEKSPNLRKWGSMPSSPQYDHTMGASAGSATGKKSSWMDRLVSAAGKLKPPAGDKFASVSGRVGRNPSAQFNLMGGLHPSYDYSFGGLNEDALKRRRKIYGSLV